MPFLQHFVILTASPSSSQNAKNMGLYTVASLDQLVLFNWPNISYHSILSYAVEITENTQCMYIFLSLVLCFVVLLLSTLIKGEF